MQIDLNKLPDSMTLFEAAAYIAFGEALSLEALRWLDYPSARIYHPDIKSVWEHCRDEALADEHCVSFLGMVDCYSGNPSQAPQSTVVRNSVGRPPSTRRLYKLLLRREKAQERDEMELVNSGPLILQALLSTEVMFTGVQGGERKTINLFDFDAVPHVDVFKGSIKGLYAGSVEAVPVKLFSSARATASFADPLQSNPDAVSGASEVQAETGTVCFGKALEWADVKIETESLVAWLAARMLDRPGVDEHEEASSGVGDSEANKALEDPPNHELAPTSAATGAPRRRRRKGGKFEKDDRLYDEWVLALAVDQNADDGGFILDLAKRFRVDIDFEDVVETDRLIGRMRQRRKRAMRQEKEQIDARTQCG